jgi:hypothetical protein
MVIGLEGRRVVDGLVAGLAHSAVGLPELPRGAVAEVDQAGVGLLEQHARGRERATGQQEACRVGAGAMREREVERVGAARFMRRMVSGRRSRIGVGGRRRRGGLGWCRCPIRRRWSRRRRRCLAFADVEGGTGLGQATAGGDGVLLERVGGGARGGLGGVRGRAGGGFRVEFGLGRGVEGEVACGQAACGDVAALARESCVGRGCGRACGRFGVELALSGRVERQIANGQSTGRDVAAATGERRVGRVRAGSSGRFGGDGSRACCRLGRDISVGGERRVEHRRWNDQARCQLREVDGPVDGDPLVGQPAAVRRDVRVVRRNVTFGYRVGLRFRVRGAHRVSSSEVRTARIRR